MKPEEFDAIVDETFETLLSNGKTIELCPGGAEKKVTHENYLEYIDLVVKARINETNKQMDWVREGVSFVIDPSILQFLTWEDVELRACGSKDITSEALKKISSYNVDEGHRHIKMFWDMFETLTQEERRKYLKFVWGRSKLPADTSSLDYKHEVHVYDHL